ncbi:hypothetical protein [Roseibium sp. MMSF_3544]|uniref:hypothetical protein n=1 Tax=unclassified Roseibium TaxID=2629323 RepID=UPI00273F9B64|nr:hypothetical protein [Roseibium sp. MMSF_3544]
MTSDPQRPDGKSPDLDPDSHATTTGMTGHGFYDANSQTQWNAISAVLPTLDIAAATLPLPADGVITLADYGCSEGRNSVTAMAQALKTLLPRTSLPVQTVHSDIPTNDFSTLFLNLRPNAKSVFGSDRVFSSAVGGSMYDQLRPDESVHLAMTFNAIAFLSKRPLKSLPGYIFPNGPSAARNNGYVAEADKEAFADQAKRDLETFLKVRARELVPGGKLLVQVFGATDDARTCDGIYDLLNDAVLAFVESGEISRETYERYYQPVYMRRLKELTEPVSDDRFGSAGLFDLEESRDYEVAVPFVEQYQKDGDLERYARDYVNFFRAFTEAVLRNALPETPDRQTLVERVYAHSQEILKTNPDLYPFRYLAVEMLLTRKG